MQVDETRYRAPDCPQVEVSRAARSTRLGGGDQQVRTRGHPAFFGAGAVIETDQVQKAVCEQHRYLVPERPFAFAGLPFGGIKRNHDIAEQACFPRAFVGFAHREREYVGRLVAAAMIAVELVNGRIVAKQNRKLGGF